MKTEKLVLFGMSILSAALVSGCASGRALSKKDSKSSTVTEHHEVYFEFNKADIRSQDEDLLDRIASKVEGDEKAVAILEGHADQIGEIQYNENLAENRARAVRVYLRDQGADPRRLTVISKGEREPVVDAHGREALQPNRRVEIRLTLTRGQDDAS